jgi:hypothetical protein
VCCVHAAAGGDARDHRRRAARAARAAPRSSRPAGEQQGAAGGPGRRAMLGRLCSLCGAVVLCSSGGTCAAAAEDDESSTELWLARLANQKRADGGVMPSIGDDAQASDHFESYPFRPFSAGYVKKALTEGVDWREKNAVTPAKSQGAHGVCGTFGQTQSAESQFAIGGGGGNPHKKPNKLTQFSEQQVLSCKCQRIITPACDGSTHS